MSEELNIAEDKEVRFFIIPAGGGKARNIRPLLTITHLIVIGSIGGQTADLHLIAPQCIALAALNEGLQLRCAMHRFSTAQDPSTVEYLTCASVLEPSI